MKLSTAYTLILKSWLKSHKNVALSISRCRFVGRSSALDVMQVAEDSFETLPTKLVSNIAGAHGTGCGVQQSGPEFRIRTPASRVPPMTLVGDSASV